MTLRIEDTDRERSTPENVDQILEALRWLELEWDGDPISQFDRRERHSARIRELVEAGHAYPDQSAGADVKAWKEAHPGAGYRGTARQEPGAAIRLRVPDAGEVVVDDAIRGDVRFPCAPMDDFVIARGDGTPLYNLAVAVDDAELGITDVIRGDDHLSNTPKQLLVLRALEADRPRYAHLPLLHGPDGRKLSKRHGAASVQELRDRGYLPAAVRNYLALLGWGTTDDETILGTEELIERFRIGQVGRSSAIFDERKLRWMNGRYMRQLDPGAYVAAVAGQLEREGLSEVAGDRERIRAACEIVQEKAQTLSEVWPLIRFLFEPPVDDPQAWERVMVPAARPRLAAARDALRESEAFDPAALEASLGAVLERAGAKPKQLYQPIRVAITGTTVSPGIFESLAVLGREESLARINAALARLDAQGPPSPADQG